MMKTQWMLLATLGLFAGVAIAQPVVRSPGHDLAREGTGDRRIALDRMELRPFNHANWKLLSDWTDGQALDAANTRGKVVLIYTFTNYLPTSLRPLATVTRLQERFGNDLIVIGVHPDTGWADTASVLARRNVTIPYARDAKGAFRSALLIDEDPDFYIIDRAGQMRFADLDTAAVTRAVEILVAETEEQSRNMSATLRDQQAEADRQFARPQDIRKEVVLSDIPELPFLVPSAEEFAQVKWPKTEPDDPNRRNFGQQPPAPGSMPAFEDAAYLPSKPEFKGRAVVAYFFNPKVYRSYQFLNEANLLQQAHGRDLVVLGVMTSQHNPNDRWQANPAPPVTAEQWIEDLTGFVRTRTPKHWIVSDFTNQFSAALVSGQQYGAQTNVLDGAQSPYVAVISSDGVIRWHGPASSRWFKFTLDEVLRLDPGVRARRAVEEEYRRALRDQISAPVPVIDEEGDE
ncbi:MAG: TlpA family protein disulfide reductase [Phycisphaeraceae bacterium]|nr:TlpA family protein disulfide reductase [Phycisphaeraceae bacterium]MCW5764177.1 TlpA family protein disulfide reductase [Phycisphaeraceae bacterium]